MKKFLIGLIFIVLCFGITIDTTEFTGFVRENDTIVGADTIQHVYKMYQSKLKNIPTFTYWLGDSGKIRYYESNDGSIYGWFNQQLLDSTDTAPDSGSFYGSTDNIDIQPVNWVLFEIITWGDDTCFVKYDLKDVLEK